MLLCSLAAAPFAILLLFYLVAAPMQLLAGEPLQLLEDKVEVGLGLLGATLVYCSPRIYFGRRRTAWLWGLGSAIGLLSLQTTMFARFGSLHGGEVLIIVDMALLAIGAVATLVGYRWTKPTRELTSPPRRE
jgi:hypothetical protein